MAIARHWTTRHDAWRKARRRYLERLEILLERSAAADARPSLRQRIRARLAARREQDDEPDEEIVNEFKQFIGPDIRLDQVELPPNTKTITAAVIEPNPQQIATSLRVSGPVAFKTQMAASGSEVQATRVMASQLQGAATRLVLEGDRETTMRTFTDNDAVEGWRRVAGRSSPCPFCLMLIGRGAVYSKQGARFQSHDRCACKPELLYRRESEPPEVRRLSEEWSRVTSGHSGKAAIEAWRKHITGQRSQRTEGAEPAEG